MKLHMLTLLIILTLVVTVGLKIFGQFIGEIESKNRNDIDSWVDKNVSLSLSKKLNQPIEEILKVLQGNLKSNLVNLINQSILSVNLTFTRLSNRRDVEIRLKIRYKDDTSFIATTERNWDALPESIRAEFLRGGANTTQRPWEFPGISLS